MHSFITVVFVCFECSELVTKVVLTHRLYGSVTCTICQQEYTIDVEVKERVPFIGEGQTD